ncbi:hypothetical protein ACQP00_38630 [Dactylosporangium sp. CS-047395]|uniref:hypothetical protein n=1 Tax=Dactylosporangium sp. CS-047395 TaxID=3239936 RepID=UPI003D943779
MTVAHDLNMFNYRSAATWLVIGLVGSVLVRGFLALTSVLILTPLLGPVVLLTGRTTGGVLWAGDLIASPVLAIVTCVVWRGLRDYRPWAIRSAQGLAWCYIATNVVAAACVIQLPDWHLLAVPLTWYVISIGNAVMVLRRVATTTPGRRTPARSAETPPPGTARRPIVRRIPA